ncbi:hypothetical protein [Helicobacter sp. MIT 05-5294]|uniref:hypothetical protein n=1 Tax=Helicobacter sp. MIT 05-5294 TaxID=1548150 RepID=UPI00051F9AF5|nr:hypothetical protein [Helicobacter sp. MIT 05-5294]TLD85464.1 hypothetical protein LS69_009350 [Helicobacter sp. MIT 05-5294]
MAIGIISYWFVSYEKFSNLQYALFIMALVLLLCLGIILVDMYLIFSNNYTIQRIDNYDSYCCRSLKYNNAFCPTLFFDNVFYA